jgi:hypothetical protein
VRESFLDPQSNNERVASKSFGFAHSRAGCIALKQGKQRHVQGWIKVIQV